MFFYFSAPPASQQYAPQLLSIFTPRLSLLPPRSFHWVPAAEALLGLLFANLFWVGMRATLPAARRSGRNPGSRNHPPKKN